jgi:carboxypeptidase family protein
MRTRFFAVVIMLATAMVGQSTSAISGRVIFVDDGLPLSDAPIQAKNTSTGAIFSARSEKDGTYVLRSLPAGSYDISASYPGLVPFKKPEVAVGDAESRRLDIRIEYPYFAPLGESREDDIARHRLAPPKGRMRHLADGTPDLSGLWLNLELVDPGNPEPLPWASARRKQQIENHMIDWPELRCLPIGPILQGEDGDNTIIQGPKTIAIFYDIGHDLPRLVYMDGRPHPKDPNPSWMGHSIGKWEGDTLVVDTVGFNGRAWATFSGLPTTERLHVIERFRRIDFGHLEKEVTIDDPGAYAKPWTMKKAAVLAPAGYEMQEYVCNENNRDVEHSVGK